MNRAAEEVTGYARDGLAGKPIVQIVPEPFRADAGTPDRAAPSPASRSTTSISSW